MQPWFKTSPEKQKLDKGRIESWRTIWDLELDCRHSWVFQRKKFQKKKSSPFMLTGKIVFKFYIWTCWTKTNMKQTLINSSSCGIELRAWGQRNERKKTGRKVVFEICYYWWWFCDSSVLWRSWFNHYKHVCILIHTCTVPNLLIVASLS